MQPGSEDKILNRKVPKSKLLECSKLNDSSMLPNLFASPITTKSKTDITVKTTPIPTSQRKTISNIKKSLTKTTDKPVNTIRSMFMRQMDRKNETISDQVNKKTESNGKETELDKNVTIVQLTPGKLHSRLTRRNSINATITSENTIHEEQSMELGKMGTPNKNRRRTLFTSSISQTTIQEENDSGTNDTILDAIAMEETLKKTATATKCNNDLTKTPSKTAGQLPDGVDVKRSNSAKKAPITKSVLKRRTLYTPQTMDETSVASTSQSKTNNRRRTLFPSTSTPKTNIQPDDVIDTVSCDAEINKKYGKQNFFSKFSLFLNEIHLFLFFQNRFFQWYAKIRN